jgi:3-hydroxybutyryl-CoA dehydrogenase
MITHPFHSAAVIGSGMMGPGIALTLAFGGLSVSIVSRTAEGAARGLQSARDLAEVLRVNQLASDSETADGLSRLTASHDFDSAAARADFIVESGPEDLPWKQELFGRLDAIAPSHAILASNTSGLSITAIASGCRRPERVLTTHYWNPAHLVPLVEIVVGDRTSAECVDAVRHLLVTCGKTPVIVHKDRPGQLGNRLQMALVREAVHIIAEGIADAEAIDSVIKNGLGIRMPAFGTLEHMDIAGLDLALRVLDYVALDLSAENRAPEHLRRKVEHGDLGAKSGRGFYDWSQKSATAIRERRDAFLIQVLQNRRRARTSTNPEL